MAALLVAAVAAVFGGQAGAARRPTCATGGKTLARSDYARIYLNGDQAYGCLFSAGRRASLGPTGSSPVAPPAALGGSMAAVLVSDIEATADYVAVYDLRPGRDFGSPVRTAGIYPTTMVVNARGWIAAVQGVPDPAHPGSYVALDGSPAVVMVADQHDSYDDAPRIVAQGNIDPQSLRRSGNHVSWTQDGTTRSYVLGSEPVE